MTFNVEGFVSDLWNSHFKVLEMKNVNACQGKKKKSRRNGS